MKKTRILMRKRNSVFFCFFTMCVSPALWAQGGDEISLDVEEARYVLGKGTMVINISSLSPESRVDAILDSVSAQTVVEADKVFISAAEQRKNNNEERALSEMSSAAFLYDLATRIRPSNEHAHIRYIKSKTFIADGDDEKRELANQFSLRGSRFLNLSRSANGGQLNHYNEKFVDIASLYRVDAFSLSSQPLDSFKEFNRELSLAKSSLARSRDNRVGEKKAIDALIVQASQLVSEKNHSEALSVVVSILLLDPSVDNVKRFDSALRSYVGSRKSE